MIDSERLAAFLFRLARDEVPFGAIERHVACVEVYHAPGAKAEYLEYAGSMGDWARDTAMRLLHELPAATYVLPPSDQTLKPQ